MKMLNKDRHMPLPVFPRDPDDDRIIFDDPSVVASGTECTGLIPAAPVDGSEIDSYSQIYDIPLSSVQTAGRPTDREPTPKQDGTARGRTGKTQID